MLSLAAGNGSLPFDPEAAIGALKKKDSRLAGLIDRVGPCTLELEEMQGTFETLLESIVYQQLTGKAAATILGRVNALFGNRFPTPGEVERSKEVELRAAGLSRQKIAAIKDLSATALAGRLPSVEELNGLADDEIIGRLTPIRGVGVWTVQMLLIFRLGRPDVLPTSDYGIRKGFALLYKRDELPRVKELEAHAERWRPYRTLASWYLWRQVELLAGGR